MLRYSYHYLTKINPRPRFHRDIQSQSKDNLQDTAGAKLQILYALTSDHTFYVLSGTVDVFTHGRSLPILPDCLCKTTRTCKVSDFDLKGQCHGMFCNFFYFMNRSYLGLAKSVTLRSVSLRGVLP